MDHRNRVLLASAGIVGIFLLVQIGALALVEPFQEGGLQGVEDTDDPSLSILYVGGILVATLFMLAAIKYGGDEILRLIIIFAGVYISFFVFDALLSLDGTAAGVPIDTIAALVPAVGLGVALYAYPEWYVIDAAGIVMGVGAAGLFGINFGILPALVLLVALAVYDAISVYGTEHMLTLASGVMDMRVPVVFVVPLSLSYSFLEESTPETLDETGEAAAAEAGADRRAAEAGADRRAAEAGADRRAAEAGADRRAAEAGADRRAAEAGADRRAAGDGADREIDEELPTTAEEIDVETLNALGPDAAAEIDRELIEAADIGDDDLAALDEGVREAVTGGARDAMFIGLGDAVIPTVLVASAGFFVDAGPTLSLLGVSATLPAVTAMVGTLLGLVVLLFLVQRGRAHAGLPLLNGGAVAGYLLGALASGLTLVEALGLESFL